MGGLWAGYGRAMCGPAAPQHSSPDANVYHGHATRDTLLRDHGEKLGRRVTGGEPREGKVLLGRRQERRHGSARREHCGMLDGQLDDGLCSKASKEEH